MPPKKAKPNPARVRPTVAGDPNRLPPFSAINNHFLQNPEPFSSSERTIVKSSLPDLILTDDFLKFLASADTSDEPPRKKQRLDVEAAVSEDQKIEIDHIVVKETTWEIKCGSKNIQLSDNFQRNDVQISASWSSDAFAFDQLNVHINSRTSILGATLPVAGAGCQDITLALLVNRKALKHKERGMKLWTDCVIRADCHTNHDRLRISFSVKWSVTDSPWHLGDWRSEIPVLQTILPLYFPDPNLSSKSSKKAQEFYQSVFSPEKEDEVAASMTTDLDTTLYPFQKRSVQWMLRREHVEWSGTEVVKHVPFRHNLPLSFVEAYDAGGEKCYVSHLFGVVTKDPTPFFEMEDGINGGILAEEMGLGKTVEIISLMTLHKRPKEEPTVFDAYIGENVRPTNATLIISPPSILQQWISEINRHAPQLKVVHYEGIKAQRWDEVEVDVVRKLESADVVIATYAVLAEEIWYTKLNAEKKLRTAPKYPRPVSPLMQLSWWRVCIDEAQMLESGVSQAAVVARLIPRINAWCITGTPVRRNVDDLHGLLIFLRYEPYASSKKVWTSFITSHDNEFRTLFGTLALRHSKHSVREELGLPPQRRYVITMPFTAIEEQHYRENFLQMCKACGLDTEGAPTTGDWTADEAAEEMRRWLVRLRQITLHPEVSRWSRRALGNRDGPLRTVDQVLDAMLEQTDLLIRTNQRFMLTTKLRQGQLRENSPRVREALDIWLDVNKEALEVVEECREELRLETVRLAEELKLQKKGSDSAAGDGEDGKDVDDPNSRLGTLRNRLRSALEVQHMAIFFLANAHFQIKSNPEMTEPDSDEFKRLEKLETDGYENAKQLRNEMLQDIIQKADKLMNRIARKAASQAFVDIPEFTSNPPKGGIESYRILGRLDELAIAFDKQAEAIDDWREKTIQFLLKPLVDEDAEVEITGDEYEQSTKVQDEVMAYVLALRAISADRGDALSGHTDNKLIEFDVDSAIRQAKKSEGHCPEKMLDLLSQRKDLKPLKELGSVRGIVAELRALQTSLNGDAIRGSIRAQSEIAIVAQQLQATQKLLTEHLKVSAALEKEIELFTNVSNARVDYYRQLQAVSDGVAPYSGPDGPATEARLKREEDEYATKLATARSKRRYLMHLKLEAENPQETRVCLICRDDNFQLGGLTVCGHQFCKECIAHWFHAHRRCPVCKRGLAAADIHSITYKPLTLTLHPESPSSPSQSRRTGMESSTLIYSAPSTSTLDAIKTTILPGPSFGTKIDTLSRHLIYLRTVSPGCKSIIFSQFSSFLDVLSSALTAHGIRFASIDSPDGTQRFRSDPSVETFLLHAKAHSSGLNLVEASHVFLCEPLLNTALELQAVARVDRIGQGRETCVWLYLVEGSVEMAIHGISVRRRLEHMGRSVRSENGCMIRAPRPDQDAALGNPSPNTTPATNRRGSRSDRAKSEDPANETSIAHNDGNEISTDTPTTPTPADNARDALLDEANSLALQEASLKHLLVDKGVGEVVPQGDLWECLFGVKGVASGAVLRDGRGFESDAEDHAVMDRALIGRVRRAEAIDRRRRIEEGTLGVGRGVDADGESERLRLG